MEKMQVNLTERVDGTRVYWTSRYSEGGYVGQLVDTVYADGADTTDWCLFVGSQEECESYIASATARAARFDTAGGTKDN